LLGAAGNASVAFLGRLLLCWGRVTALTLLAALAGGGAVAAGRSASGCTDPVVHDRYDGFHVGVPAGWYLSSTGGLIVVAKDYSQQTEGFVEPAYLGKGQSKEAFLSRVLVSLSKKATAGANALTFRVNGAATAVASGHVGTVPVAGQASVSFLPVRGTHGRELGVVSGYWAPTSDLGGERAQLASIGACYGPEVGTLFRFFKDQAFGYTLPPGWTVGNETADELFLDDGPNASANFILAGPFPASEGVTDAQSLLRFSFQKLGLKIDTVLATASSPPQTAANGGTEQEVITEFLGSLGSKKLHGLVRVISSTGGGVTSGALRIAVATPELWNSLNGALIWVTYGIQHAFTQDLHAIQQAQQQLAGFAQQVAGFDQALNGTDLVQDPTTGIQYEAPYSAYDPAGPDGPGYYIGSPGSLRKLDVITPG
jgi:hypothetical protein